VLVPVRPGGKPGKSPNRKKSPAEAGRDEYEEHPSSRNLLNRGLYKIEHFNDFFHFKLKVRSLAVGARIAALASRIARMNVVRFMVFFALGLLLPLLLLVIMRLLGLS
jgi:hypothetical protein